MFFNLTFFKTCGDNLKILATSLSLLFYDIIRAVICKDETNPSQIVKWSDEIIWPDCSTPILQPNYFILSITELNPSLELTMFLPG